MPAKKSILWFKSVLYTLTTGQTKILMNVTAQHQVSSSTATGWPKGLGITKWRPCDSSFPAAQIFANREGRISNWAGIFINGKRPVCDNKEKSHGDCTARVWWVQHSPTHKLTARHSSTALPYQHTNQILLWHEKPCTLAFKNSVLEIISPKYSSHLFQKPTRR